MPDLNINRVPDENSLPDNSLLKEEELFLQLQNILIAQERHPEELNTLEKAFLYAQKMHEGQFRKNQENYIVHPVSVAIILAGIPVDTPTVISALLHDVMEDTPATADEIKAQFGEEVLKLVQGVTKLGRFEFASKEDAHAENFRRMFLAMADDIRVIMLKLADRLHNMQTLTYMKPEKQLKTANETLEIFAPLANRMGMGKIRAELEDLSLKYLDPSMYQVIEKEISSTQHEREDTIARMIERIQDQLTDSPKKAKIYGRVKNFYSIYKKMQLQQKKVHEIYDISAVRIIVHLERECYEVLGIIHHAFTPIPGRFKDYIAMPKSNLYQSLHTTVIGPSGRPLEVQIRTREMHRVAEYGIAAHWRYKEAGSSRFTLDNQDEQMAWLRQMVEMKNETGNAQEYVDSVKLDLFRDEVFVFTPKGRVVVLPKASTPIDFAYRIHTEIGHSCTGAKVNGRITPLSQPLTNGNIVEIITGKKPSPRLDWINFVQTQTAKSRIRQWYKKQQRDVHVEHGKRLLDAELTRATTDEMLKNGKLYQVAQEMNYASVDDLLAALGYGETNIVRVINRLRKPDIQEPEALSLQGMAIRQTRSYADSKLPRPSFEGLDGMLYQLAKCCNPLPGEPILGVVTRSRGVMIHREDCMNLQQSNPDRRMITGWGAEQQQSGKHYVKLTILVIDRVGVLKDILAKVADCNVNLANTKVKILPDATAIIDLTLEVSSLQHLDKVRNAIDQVNDVVSIRRHRNSSRTKQ
jgi:GTP diphosphokinase / guanosine-3',5'-bis(diphosphate) 3'-diphosphatase